jgi:VWFA-related protein
MTPLLIAALLAPAASPAPAGELRTITLSVVDDKGRPVHTLEPRDVSVQENGVARELTRLELDRRPLTLAVIVDSSAAMASSYRLNAVDAVLQFLLRLPEGSRYAIWTTGDRPTKILDYGDNRAAAARALRRVIPQGGNTLLDALVEASRDLKHREDGRSAIVAVTASGVGFTNYDRRQVVDLVEDHPASVLSVVLDDGGTRSPMRADADEVGGPDYDYVLSELASRSGGVRETVLSPMALDRALALLGAQLSAEYRATYVSAAPQKDAKVEVTVAWPGVKVRVGDRRR